MVLSFMFEGAQLIWDSIFSPDTMSSFRNRAFISLLRGFGGSVWIVAAFSWYHKRWTWAVIATILGYVLGLGSFQFGKAS